MDHILKSEVLVVVLQKPSGLPLSEFAKLFHHTHGYPLTLSRYGYSSLRQLLDDMKDVVLVVEQGTQGALIRSRYLSRHVFLLVGKDGSFIEGLQPAPTQGGLSAGDQAWGLPGFNHPPGREAAAWPKMPGHVFVPNPLASGPRAALLKNPTDSKLQPQFPGGSYNPSNRPFGLSYQQTCKQRLASPFPLGQYPNSQPRSPHPSAQVSTPTFLTLAPQKQETNPVPCASKQPQKPPTSSPPNLNHPRQEVHLVQQTSKPCAPSSLYSSVVSGKRQENTRLSPGSQSLAAASSSWVQAPGTCPNITDTQQVPTPLSLTTSNFPPLTGEPHNAVLKKGSSDCSGSVGTQLCTLQLSASEFPPLTAESPKSISQNSNAASEHSNASTGEQASTQLPLTSADFPHLTGESQKLIPNTTKVASDRFQSKPEKSTIGPELKQKIRCVLEQHPDGMSLAQFKSAYLCMFNHLLPLNGYASVKELLAELEDVVKMRGLGVQMIVFPRSSGVSHSGVTMEEFGFSLKEVVPSSIKQDAACGDASKSKVPPPMNPKPISSQHMDSRVFRPMSSLPAVCRCPPISYPPTHHEATYSQPNYNFNPAVPTFSPCLPACYSRLPQLMSRGPSLPFPSNFSGAAGPFPHGLPLPAPPQPFIFQRLPMVGSSSYAASPLLAFPPAFSQVTGFAAHPLMYSPRLNSFQAAGISPLAHTGWARTAQPLQKGVGQQSSALQATSVHGAAQPNVESHSAEIRPQETVPELKTTSLQETLTISLDQTKPQPPVQLVLPFTKLSQSEDLNPECSLHEHSDEKPSSRIMVDCSGLSDVLALPFTESIVEDHNVEGSLSEMSKEEPCSIITVDPTCKSEVSLPQTETSQIECLNPGGSLGQISMMDRHSGVVVDSTWDSEISALPHTETSTTEDLDKEGLVSESLKEKPSSRTMVDPTGESEVSLLHLTELSRSENLNPKGSLGETIKKKPNSKIVVDPTSHSEISVLPQTEISKGDLNPDGSFESSNEKPSSITVVDTTCELATFLLPITESPHAVELNPEGSVCETSIEDTGSTTMLDATLKPATLPLAHTEPSEAEELNPDGCLVSFSEEKLRYRSMVDPVLHSSSSEDSFLEAFQEADSTGGSSDVGTAAGFGLPSDSAGSHDPVAEPSTASCRIL